VSSNAPLAALSPDEQFMALSVKDSGLAVVRLASGEVKDVALPATAHASISGLGWDDNQMLFAMGEGKEMVVGGATAPEFNTVTLPTPKTQTVIVDRPANFSFVRYHVGQSAGCDEKAAGQACELFVYDKQKHRSITIKHGLPNEMSYVLNEVRGVLVYAEPEEKQVSQRVSKHVVKTISMRTIPAAERVVVVDLDSEARVHLTLPTEPDNQWRTITLLDGQPVSGGFRVAYSVRGDCDRNTAKEAAALGAAVVAANEWSVCVVTIPMPPAGTMVEAVAAKPASKGRSLLHPFSH